MVSSLDAAPLRKRMVESMAIRVLIVDDHKVVRYGLRTLLSSYLDVEVVGEAEEGTAALKAAADLSPDVILLDILMPGSDGVEVAYELRQRVPNARIIILTAFNNDEYILGALRAGAYAYLLKSTSDETLIQTIRFVYQGQRVISPELMDRVLQQFQVLAQASARGESTLSGEELRVLQLIASGATNEEIAKEINWSARTVKRKVEEIISKLEVHNRTQAVAVAIKRGLI